MVPTVRLGDYLSISSTPAGCLVHRRPLRSNRSGTVTPMPIGLVSPATTYQDTVRRRFSNQLGNRVSHPEPGRPSPTVNMVQLRLLENDESLHTILEEQPRSDSDGSTKTDIGSSTVLNSPCKSDDEFSTPPICPG